MPIAEVNGTKLHYHITGKKGTPIVFIHPPMMTVQTFNYQKAQLSDEFKVITFDVRGHGESAPSERRITYPLLVEDIRQLLDHLGEDKAYVCGYSSGASVALEALLTYPDRFLGGIVVSGTSELKDAYNKGRIWLATQLAKLGVKRPLAAAVSAGNADMMLTFQNLYGSSMKGDVRNMYEYCRNSLIYDCTHRLGAIKQPVLLIYGQKDQAYHRYAHLLHDQLPNSSLYFIKDAKHQVPIKNAVRMNDLIRLWIESLQETEKERHELDWEIARKLNPAMYAHDEGAESLQMQ